jgi:preprotein translocase subunit SecA
MKRRESVTLTEEGVARVETLLKTDNLYDSLKTSIFFTMSTRH